MCAHLKISHHYKTPFNYTHNFLQSDHKRLNLLLLKQPGYSSAISFKALPGRAGRHSTWLVGGLGESIGDLRHARSGIDGAGTCCASSLSDRRAVIRDSLRESRVNRVIWPR